MEAVQVADPTGWSSKLILVVVSLRDTMGEKLDDSHKSVNDDEKDVDELAASPSALNDSSSGQDDGILNASDRRMISAQHNLKPDGFFVRVLKVIFYIPMKILSVFGISLWQNNLQVSGNCKYLLVCHFIDIK